jgi:DNA polymerase-3 subunit beta
MLKIGIDSGALATALGLAALVLDSKNKVEVLDAVHVTAADSTIMLTTNVMARALTATVPASVEAPGEAAVRAEALTGLAAGFPLDTTVALTGGEDGLRVSCGRSRFRLPVIPVQNLPAVPALDGELGRVELDRTVLLRLLAIPLVCVEEDRARNYMAGICLHNVGEELVGVGTNGSQLARVSVPATDVLSSDSSLIVPRDTVRVLVRLLGRSETEQITLCRSRTLLQVEAEGFHLVTKLIDGTFPDYARVIPKPNQANRCTVDCTELRSALERAAALVEKNLHDTLRLAWDDGGELHLSLPRQPGSAEDAVAAETAGRGDTTVAISQLDEILEQMDGKRVQLELADPHSPIRITDPEDGTCLFLQMPMLGFATSSGMKPNTPADPPHRPCVNSTLVAERHCNETL